MGRIKSLDLKLFIQNADFKRFLVEKKLTILFNLEFTLMNHNFGFKSTHWIRLLNVLPGTFSHFFLLVRKALTKVTKFKV